MYDLCRENKGADQLRGYREADLRLCFRICKKPVFSRRGSFQIQCIKIAKGSFNKLHMNDHLQNPPYFILGQLTNPHLSASGVLVSTIFSYGALHSIRLALSAKYTEHFKPCAAEENNHNI